MNQCLVQISNIGNAIPTMAALHKWTSEVTSMKVAFALGNVHSSIAYFSFRLDGRIGASRVQLPASFYQNLLVTAACCFLHASVPHVHAESALFFQSDSVQLGLTRQPCTA